jgi:hypothetical protein
LIKRGASARRTEYKNGGQKNKGTEKCLSVVPRRMANARRKSIFLSSLFISVQIEFASDFLFS